MAASATTLTEMESPSAHALRALTRQLPQDLNKAIRVHSYDRPRSRGSGDVDAVGGHERGGTGDRLSSKVGKVHVRQGQSEGSLLRPGHRGKVVDEARQALGVVRQGLEVVLHPPGSRRSASASTGGIDGGQRGAKFVGEVGHEPDACPLGGLKALGRAALTHAARDVEFGAHAGAWELVRSSRRSPAALLRRPRSPRVG